MQQSRKLLLKRRKRFLGHFGHYPYRKFHIDLINGAEPYHCQRPHYVIQADIPKYQKEFEGQVDLGLFDRVNNTEWGFPCFIHPKNNETICAIKDFCKLNKNNFASTAFSLRLTSQCDTLHLNSTENPRNTALLSRPLANTAKLFYLMASNCAPMGPSPQWSIPENANTQIECTLFMYTARPKSRGFVYLRRHLLDPPPPPEQNVCCT